MKVSNLGPGVTERELRAMAETAYCASRLLHNVGTWEPVPEHTTRRLAVARAKGFDTKVSPKPEKCNMAPSEFEEWKELFVATMVAMDAIWEPILTSPAMSSSKKMRRVDIAAFLDGLKLDPSIHKQDSKILFVNLLQHTKDDDSNKVKSN